MTDSSSPWPNRQAPGQDPIRLAPEQNPIRRVPDDPQFVEPLAISVRIEFEPARHPWRGPVVAWTAIGAAIIVL
jgi:hypothetical protein